MLFNKLLTTDMVTGFIKIFLGIAIVTYHKTVPYLLLAGCALLSLETMLYWYFAFSAKSFSFLEKAERLAVILISVWMPTILALVGVLLGKGNVIHNAFVPLSSPFLFGLMLHLLYGPKSFLVQGK